MKAVATTVLLGNPSVHEPIAENGAVVGHKPRPDLGHQVTELGIPADVVKDLIAGAKMLPKAIDERGREQLLVHLLTSSGLERWEVAFKHLAEVVALHARAGLSWVATADEKLQAVLEEFFGTESPAKLADALELAGIEGDRWDSIRESIDGPTAIKTTAGVDVLGSNGFNTASTVAQFNYFGLTANNTAVSSANTSLAEEITTAGGGLIRKQATYAHTSGTSTTTLTVTFTANGSDALPVTVNKFGVFNKATSGGTMGIESKITAATFNAAEDNCTLTETITTT